MNSKDLKFVVQEKYGKIASQSKIQNETSCCGASECCTVEYAIFSENYNKESGYNPDADLGLGCGIPTQFANISEGDSVLDLGSGAGNDCFVARAIVGESGRVTGLDFTDEMLKKARENALKLKFNNVDFVQGDIEEMPLDNNSYDVVISNCVLNLVPDKSKAFQEIFRVLKPDGQFCVSDVVLKGVLPDALRHDAEMYAGCVSGAIDINEYLMIIEKSKFTDIQIHKEKPIIIPDEILSTYLNDEEMDQFKNGNTGIYSITLSAAKAVE